MSSTKAGDAGSRSLERRLAAAEVLARVGTFEAHGQKVLACSSEVLGIHGYDRGDTPATLDRLLERVHPEDRPMLDAAVANARESGEPYRVRYRVVRPDGTRRVVDAHGVVEQGPGGEAVIHGAIKDVTENELTVTRLVAAESRYSAIVEHANDGIWILDRKSCTTFVNRRMSEMLELPPGDVLGRPPADFADGEFPDLAEERRTHFEARFIRSSGRELWAAISLSRLPDTHGGGTLLVLTDITVRKQMEDRLRQAAERDALTGLMSRGRFEQMLDQLLEQGAQTGEPLALLFLDIDYFKYVNDSFGHAVGDALLREVAEALPDLVRDGDVVGRFAGDEFVIALPASDCDVAVAVAERFLNVIRDRRWQTLSRITASVGVAMAEGGRPTTRPELLIAADAALHDAKSNGRDQVTLYSGQGGGGGFRWVDEIRAALDEDRLVLHGQAIVPADGGPGKRRFELLLRMTARDGALVPPGSFIPAAEQFGIMPELDRWVIGQAIGLAQRGIAVEMNLSGTSLGDSQIHAAVEAAVAGGLRPDLLTFEVTETAASRNIEAARAFAEQLDRLGCAFALDDFGTGFGSLIYLKHLPVSQLKIDIEFVRDLVTSAADQRLVRAIVQMAEPLGVETVAEGVEDEETLVLLREIGVDYVQGFHIDRPTLFEREPAAASQG